MKRLSILLAIFLQTGCYHQIPVPSPKVDGVKSTIVSQTLADPAWKRALKTATTDEGAVDFTGLGESPEDLYAYVAYISEVSPINHPAFFPDHEWRLAYYINAYNALALYGIIRVGYPAGFSKNSEHMRFYEHNRFSVGQKNFSLYQLKDKIIRPLGDPRIHFALSDLVKSSPQLGREPFRGETLEQQLEDSAARFINSEKYVQVDAEQKFVRLAEIFKTYAKDFADPTKSPAALISFLNKYRNEKIDENFQISYLPADWTVPYASPSQDGPTANQPDPEN